MAFDPTPAIGQICRSEGLWLHVDGAMAGIAALAPEYRWVNEGIDIADSYCTNPHKWMGVNFDCTTFWTADRSALLGALSILPEYLRLSANDAGVGHFTRTVLDGRSVLRISVGARTTTAAHVDQAWRSLHSLVDEAK